MILNDAAPTKNVATTMAARAMRKGIMRHPGWEELAELRRYGRQSAMMRLTSRSPLACRPEPQMSFLPSGLNIGNPSKPSSLVIWVSPLPSSETM